MKKIYILFICLFLSSCSILFPEGITFNPANYNYNYLTFNKRLDYNNESYLLFPTSFGDSDFNNNANLNYVVDFFKEKLGNKISLKKDYKDDNGKLIIPFISGYNITDEEILFLKENTDLKYLILSKILYLKNLKDVSFPGNSKGRLNDSKSGAMSFIKIVDIKSNTVLLEMNCVGEVSVSENRDLATGEGKLQPKAIYKDSYSLGEKTMKKLLKKIK
ncbi:hypothetical protein [Polaribacter filamentus]|uniref:hypothetical protein n=1 Tax=Polaribacter filamentus TaxID=53483 RepID=UPI0011B09ADE|nr:hypothetical protein [Polaribacter filamentus]